jgi:hypothetical protein
MGRDPGFYRQKVTQFTYELGWLNTIVTLSDKRAAGLSKFFHSSFVIAA